MQQNGAGDQSARSRWPDEVPGSHSTGEQDPVFNQDDFDGESGDPYAGYVPPQWDSWSDEPSNYPVPAAGDDERPGESTQQWQFPEAVGADDAEDPTVDDLAASGGFEGDGLEGDDADDDDYPDYDDTDPVTGEPLVLNADLVVAGRYRLVTELALRGNTHSWQAFDQKLSRPVMVHLVEHSPTRNARVLTAARDSAVATDSRFLRVLDAIDAPNIDVPGVGACVVSEFVPGLSVEKLLASGPLSGVEAAWVVRELADALAPMHQKGLFHQQLNPDTVIITATGNIKIVGFLIEEAMYPTAERPFPGDDSWQSKQEADVRALGQLLYAMLVNRWPAPHAQADRRHWGLAPAPMDGHGWLTPRQVRAGVSPALDVVCDQVLSSVPRTGAAPITTAAQLNDALSRVLGTADASADLEHRVRYPVTSRNEPTGGHPPPTTAAQQQLGGLPQGGPRAAPAVGALPRPGSTPAPASSTTPAPVMGSGLARPRPAPRRWLSVLVAIVAIVLVGSLIAVAINMRTPESGGGDSPSASASAQPVKHPIAKVDDFDPEADGGNDEENPNQVALAWDNDPKTAWTTLRYLNNAKLGGLKPGVGLVVDLGQVVDVGRVQLTMQGSPTGVAIHVPAENTDKADAEAPMGGIDQWRQIAANPAAGATANLSPSQVTKSRYILVYLTSLPSIGGQAYRGGIAEIGVFDR
ncbi:protein kinase family protein [Propionibacteriaceae bacterium G57]|uniref:protein kinase family protein n=1 Tax=Aestuariimicrobium sp. G57 TaxID=3418485 RepID=UPI003DA708D6